MANLAGIGGIVAKIKDVIKNLRKPIDKAVEKVVGFVADKAKAFMGQKEKPVPREEKESPEKTKKLSRGITAIDQEEQKYLENNKILREDAEKVAVTVKRAHPVFKSLSVADGGESWDYDYVASPGRIKEGPEKAENDKTIKETVEKEKYHRNMSERRKALLRDANDPNSNLSQEARDFIKQTNGHNVPIDYEVSHEIPLYIEKSIEGKKALDKAENMKIIPKTLHRQRHKACGDMFHDFPR